MEHVRPLLGKSQAAVRAPFSVFGPSLLVAKRKREEQLRPLLEKRNISSLAVLGARAAQLSNWLKDA